MDKIVALSSSARVHLPSSESAAASARRTTSPLRRAAEDERGTSGGARSRRDVRDRLGDPSTPRVQASVTEGFTDPLVDCKTCGQRFFALTPD
jgi:hypothetical protein